MKYFYFGTLPIFNVTPHVNRIGVADTSLHEMIYVTNIKTKNYFILKGYDFKIFICHVTKFEHLDDIMNLRQAHGILDTHIIVSNITDKAEVLFNLDADTDLSIRVHFLNKESELENFLIKLLHCLD